MQFGVSNEYDLKLQLAAEEFKSIRLKMHEDSPKHSRDLEKRIKRQSALLKKNANEMGKNDSIRSKELSKLHEQNTKLLNLFTTAEINYQLIQQGKSPSEYPPVEGLTSSDKKVATQSDVFFEAKTYAEELNHSAQKLIDERDVAVDHIQYNTRVCILNVKIDILKNAVRNLRNLTPDEKEAILNLLDIKPLTKGAFPNYEQVVLEKVIDEIEKDFYSFNRVSNLFDEVMQILAQKKRQLNHHENVNRDNSSTLKKRNFILKFFHHLKPFFH